VSQPFRLIRRRGSRLSLLYCWRAREVVVVLARGRPQHYFGAADERVRQAARSRETLQLCAFVHGQFEGGFGASGEHRAAYRRLYNIASYLWDTTLDRNI